MITPISLRGSPVSSCFRVSVLARRSEGVETCGRASRGAPGGVAAAVAVAAGRRASGQFADFRVLLLHLVSRASHKRTALLIRVAESDGSRTKTQTRVSDPLAGRRVVIVTLRDG